ncbi:MAG: hypothetical protein LBV55_00740 [Acholeplasmatales bacterium]|jgi:hypothetical protein|nr:hypothetical protein [Acholeplasmatales bacterium]
MELIAKKYQNSKIIKLLALAFTVLSGLSIITGIVFMIVHNSALNSLGIALIIIGVLFVLIVLYFLVLINKAKQNKELIAFDHRAGTLIMETTYQSGVREKINELSNITFVFHKTRRQVQTFGTLCLEFAERIYNIKLVAEVETVARVLFQLKQDNPLLNEQIS